MPLKRKNLNAESAPGKMLTLTRGTRSRYVIVYQEGVETRREAAFILREYIKKATGAELTISKEWPVPREPGKLPYKYIFVGDSEYVRSLGVDLTGFGPETYLIQARLGNLILAGLDSQGSPWDLNPTYGRINTPTLHAVSRFLEEYIGARWYWPTWDPDHEAALGEGHTPGFGEKYERLEQLQVPRSLYSKSEPTFPIRDIQIVWSKDSFPESIDEEFRKALAKRNARWIRLNRVGVYDRIWHQHYWYKLMPRPRYDTAAKDATEPQWVGRGDRFFAYYNPKYYRGPTDEAANSNRIRGGKENNHDNLDTDHQLCVSGRKDPPDGSVSEGVGEGLCGSETDECPQIYKEITALEHLTATGLIGLDPTNPSLRSLPIVPNDSFGHCNCDPCRAKDYGDTLPLGGGRNIGDRMFWFFRTLAAKLAAIYPANAATGYPGLRVTTYAYGSYVLPHELTRQADNSAYFAQSPNLIVYDTHNGYGFKYSDIYKEGDRENNTKAESIYRMERWGSTASSSDDNVKSQLAVYMHPYHADGIGPYNEHLMLASQEPIADKLARALFHRYLGGYLQIDGIGHWPDRYLAARLLCDAPPLDGQDLTLDDYLQQFSDRADAILKDYYEGLFGSYVSPDSQPTPDSSGTLIKKFYDLISQQTALAVQNATRAETYRATVGNWSQGELIDQLFSPIVEQADQLLNQAWEILSQVADGSAQKELAHLKLIQKHWEFTKQTITLFDNLDVYGALKLNNHVYEEKELTALAKVWALMWAKEPERTALVADMNDTDTNPDLCSLAVLPNAVNHEYSAGKNNPLVTKSRKAINMIDARRIIPSILAIQQDLAAQDADAGNAVRRPEEAAYLSWSPAEVQIDWYGRSGGKLYLVAINETGNPIEVNLKIDNVDPNNLDPNVDRKLFRVDGEGVTYTKGNGLKNEEFDPMKDASGLTKQSVVVSDAATFTAQQGVTVLVWQGANLAPYTNAVLAWDGGKYVTEYPFANRKALNLHMVIRDDDWIKNSEGGGQFYIRKGDFKKDIKSKNVGWMPNVAPHYEYVMSDYLNVIPDTAGKGVYMIYGALYDRDGAKRFASAGDGEAFCLQLNLN